jgi:hypothetical protein
MEVSIPRTVLLIKGEMTMQVYTTPKKLKEVGIPMSLRPDDAPIDIVAFGLDAALQIPHSALCGRGLKRRKLLFAVACCQNVWHLLDDSDRRTVRAAHLYAHKEISRAEWRAVWHEVNKSEVRTTVVGALLVAASKQSIKLLAAGAARVAAEAAIKNADGFVAKAMAGDIAWNAAYKAAREYQTAAFKTIFSGDY